MANPPIVAIDIADPAGGRPITEAADPAVAAASILAASILAASILGGAT